MKLGIVTLAASTVVLAGCTVYFASELSRERERNTLALAEASPAAVPGRSPSPSAGTELSSPSDSTAGAPASAAGDAAAAPTASASRSVEESRRERNREQAAEFLRRYDNPETRAALLEEQINSQRRFYSLLRSELGIDAEGFDQLVKLLATQKIDRRVRVARCLTEPLCVPMDSGGGIQERQAIVDLIGEKNTVKLLDFVRDPSRDSVLATFQARLGPRRELSPQQLGELESAFFDEVARTSQEMESHGHSTRNYATRYGVIVYASDTKTLDERMASAAASIDRLRDRASMLLNGKQLEIFNQTQDDALLTFRPYARVGIAALALGYDEP